MFNPQTCSWRRFALNCRKSHYNREVAKRDAEKIGVPFIVAYIFLVSQTEREMDFVDYPALEPVVNWMKGKMKHGSARTNL